MKIIRFILSAAFLLAFFGVIMAQQDTIVVPPPLGPDATINDFLNLYSGLESAIILILGYLHNWIPGINIIKAKWLRIVLIGAVTAVIFTALGFNSGLSTALIFLQTVGFYELIFKKVQPSPAVTLINYKKAA